MFADLSDAPPDPILGMAQVFAGDPSPQKIDLGIGVYKDENGNVIVLDTVKQAEEYLRNTQTTKSYLSSAGNPQYNDAVRGLIFAPGSDAHGRARTIQTPGGTGALRVGADFIAKLRPGARVFMPDPTWPNHPALFRAAGVETVVYPYYDVAAGRIRFDAMMDALGEQLTANDVLLLHGCCHNPSGADPDQAQWAAIAELLERTGAMPFVDLAYLGFGHGLEPDRAGINILAARLPEMIVASSCSKNFALYRERTGALTLVAGERQVEAAKGHLLPVVRANYSMPPDHGAAVVAHILGTPALRAEWEVELNGMRERIRRVRLELVNQLAGKGGRDFSYLADQTGMFALLGISPAQVQSLRSDWHIYATDSGRANLAGLTMANVAHAAEAFASVTR